MNRILIQIKKIANSKLKIVLIGDKITKKWFQIMMYALKIVQLLHLLMNIQDNATMTVHTIRLKLALCVMIV